jgi:hypothetical protein
MAKVTDMVGPHMHGMIPQPASPFTMGSLVTTIEGLGVLRVGDTAT